MTLVEDGPTGERPTLLVMTSTYPRWVGDHEPGFVHELCRRLTAEFDVVVVAPSAPGAATRECMDGVDVHRFRYAPAAAETLVNDGGIVGNLRRSRWKLALLPGFFAMQAWTAWRITRQRRVAAIHAHWLVPQGLICAVLRRTVWWRIPLVVTSHGSDLFALKGSVFDAIRRFVMDASAAVAVVSRGMRDALVAQVGERTPIHVAPMGVDMTSRFVPGDEPRSTDEILFVGRLMEVKGLHHLVDAMPAIIARRAGAFLTVVGFGPEEARLRAQVERLGLGDKVRFVGPVAQAELPSHYRRAAVLVAPSVQLRAGDQEGLGLVTIEAMACGCPVVVSDLSTVRDAVDGTPAVRVMPGDADAIARGVLDVLSSPATHAIPPAQRAALAARFGWDAVAARYVELLRSAIR